MALSGLEIYKHLPRENCKECGVATCLAFAMKVAGGQASLEECPRLSDEAKSALGEASAPPQQLVKIGMGEKAREIGQETVLYRHEERFHHPTVVGIRVNDELDDAAIEERCKAISALKFERMGGTLAPDLVAVYNGSGDAERFAKAAQIANNVSGKTVALMSSNANSLRAAAEPLVNERPLLWATDGSANDEAVNLAKQLSLPLCLEAPGFDELAAVSESARQAGLKDIILSPGRMEKKVFEFLTQTRRAAIQKKFRPIGYPIAMTALAEDPIQALTDACWYVLKYAGVVVVDLIKREEILTLLTTRQDIYTNPQTPVQVEPGVHTVGEPGADAPVLVTTNFALSYYSVEPEVEAARVPSYILSVDTEGTSVLTAWAADKFNSETITAALKKSELESKVNHHKVVLPGLVAVLSASVKDDSGWDVMVGPKEASGLVPFLKNEWKP